MSRKLHILEHAIVDHHLAHIRSEETASGEFRKRMQALGGLLVAEATRKLPQRLTEVRTPLEAVECRDIAGRIAAVPILRAGLVLVEPFLELVPEGEVRHLGMFRDESTAKPVHYYNKLPDDNPPAVGFVLDPMLATGGSAVHAIETLTQWGVSRICLVTILSAPEGIERVTTEFPDVSIYTCAIDRELNDRKFILPGLGDAGDRIFNTGNNDG